MIWKEKPSSFNYNGNPVTRTTFFFDSPVGQFRVFEAVSGRTFYNHPFRAINPNDPYQDISPSVQNKCQNLEDGKKICEEIWTNFKIKINQY